MSDKKVELLSFNDDVVDMRSLLELDSTQLVQVVGGVTFSSAGEECSTLSSCSCFGTYQSCSRLV